MPDPEHLLTPAPVPAQTQPAPQPEPFRPLRACGRYLAEHPWESVVLLNRGLCLGGRTQHGLNSESHAAVSVEWRCRQLAETSAGEVLDFLSACRTQAPFLFLNEETFAEIGRRLAERLFVSLSAARRREAVAVLNLFVEGRLGRADFEARLDLLWEAASFKAGDRVQTLRGTSHGTVVAILEDGRVTWRPDGGALDFTTPAETLAAERTP